MKDVNSVHYLVLVGKIPRCGYVNSVYYLMLVGKISGVWKMLTVCIT